jgi:thiamine biosynthesis lipoprotein
MTANVVGRTFEVMGTIATVLISPGPLSESAVDKAFEEATYQLRRTDEIFSTYQRDSQISRIRQGELDLAAADSVVGQVYEACQRAREVTHGYFDPWAIPGGFDPTGLVKGFALGQACQRLRDSGARGALVNAGGDFAAFGEPGPDQAWVVALRHPGRSDTTIAQLVVPSPGALATSGTYERGQHLLDPFRGLPTARAASASVAGPDPGLADALATALAVAGVPGLAWFGDLDGYFGLVVDANLEMRATPGFPIVPGSVSIWRHTI